MTLTVGDQRVATVRAGNDRAGLAASDDGRRITLPVSARIAALRDVSFFRSLPKPVLAEIAARVEAVLVADGAAIFAKGEPGDCLYVVAAGVVRIHDDGLILSELGPGAVFGEMAALDAEVRSASATALATTTLIRLERALLLELVERQPAVARGIIQVLSQRLRHRVHDLGEDFAYIQQVARVAAAARAVEVGDYQSAMLTEVAARTDALGHLARVFQQMVEEVQTREQRLERQVWELRIEIDRTRQERQVAEIVDDDFFRQLQRQATDLRQVLDGDD